MSNRCFEKISNVGFCNWLFSLDPTEKEPLSNVDRLETTMKTTAISRYNASNRLKWQGKIAFSTTTILSLGLILIPLMQVGNIRLAFNQEILTTMQIFLAVAVLVFSILIGTARYDLRSEQLSDCADKLKSLIRDLRHIKDTSKGDNDDFIKEMQNNYSNIYTSVENHTHNDYLLTKLKTKDIFYITGLVRVFNWSLYWGKAILFNLSVPLFLLSIESIFILDMLGVTEIFTPYLQESI